MKLSEKVKTAMDALGCTQRDVAKTTRLAQTTISRLVMGKMDAACSLDVYLPVKQALGLKGDEPACSLHIQPIAAKPRPARTPKPDRPNEVNQAAIMGRLASLEAGQAKILTALGEILRRTEDLIPPTPKET